MVMIKTVYAASYPILYTFRRCPYAMRARIAIYSAGIICELREVVLKDKPQHMVSISPKATVPVLQLLDGQVIDESLDVMFWALREYDPDGWLGVASDETMMCIRKNDSEFKYYLDRYKYHQRYPQQSQYEYRQQAESFLQELEQRLHQYHGQGLMGESNQSRGCRDFSIC